MEDEVSFDEYALLPKGNILIKFFFRISIFDVIKLSSSCKVSCNFIRVSKGNVICAKFVKMKR